MFAASKSGRAATATDPFFRYVPLLLETTTTNGQQNNTFLDSSTNNYTWTRSGTPTQGSVTPYWPDGYWGNYFAGPAGSAGSNISVTSSTLNPNATAITIEFWVYCNKLNDNQTIYETGPGNIGDLVIYGINAAGTISFGTAGVSFAVASGLSANTWYYIACVKNATTSYSVYVNGTRSAGPTVVGTANSATAVNIGARNAGASLSFNGYISNLRVTTSELYTTSTISVPTVPFSPIANTQLLTCQSNRFKDNSTNNLAITSNSSPRTQPFQPFSPAASYTTAAYGGSIYNGTKTDVVTAASVAALTTFTGDFTIDCWVYPTDTGQSTSWGILDTRTSGQTPAAWVWGLSSYSSGWTLQFYNSSGSVTSFTTTKIQANCWTHVVLQRNGSTVRAFVNGVVDATTGTISGTITGGTSTVYIANTKDNALSTYGNVGYTSNLRIVNGTAVYTTTGFTPPTAPVTAITNTSLLVNATNAGIYDAAVQNNVLTVGSAQASTTQFKWSPTSMKFNGTTDYLTTIDGPQLQLNAGDFTIDGWVYLSAIGVAYGIISKGTATTGWSVNVTALNKLQFSYTASNLTGTTSLATGIWYYFAVVRSGSATGNLKVYLNGTVDATSGGAVTDAFTQTNTLYVGADRVGMSLLSGYLQDVRITKYARTITTPTAAFPTR
jgi:hypothetical protein